MKEIRDLICEMGYEDSTVFDEPSYDNAIIGVSTDGEVIYDFDLMVESLMETDNIDETDAIDFIDYNAIRSLPYAPSPKPIVMYKIPEEFKK